MPFWSPLEHSKGWRTSVRPSSHLLAPYRYLDSSGHLTQHEALVFKQVNSSCYWPPWLTLLLPWEINKPSSTEHVYYRHWIKDSKTPFLMYLKWHVHDIYSVQKHQNPRKPTKTCTQQSFMIAATRLQSHGTWWTCEHLLSSQWAHVSSEFYSLSHIHFSRAICGEARYWLLSRG